MNRFSIREIQDTGPIINASISITSVWFALWKRIGKGAAHPQPEMTATVRRSAYSSDSYPLHSICHAHDFCHSPFEHDEEAVIGEIFHIPHQIRAMRESGVQGFEGWRRIPPDVVARQSSNRGSATMGETDIVGIDGPAPFSDHLTDLLRADARDPCRLPAGRNWRISRRNPPGRAYRMESGRSERLSSRARRAERDRPG